MASKTALHIMIYNYNANKNWFKLWSRLSLNSKFKFAWSYCLRFYLFNFLSYLSLRTFSKFIFFHASSLVLYTGMFISLSVYILVRMFLLIFPFVFTLMCMIERVVIWCGFYLNWQIYPARVDGLTWCWTSILGGDFVFILI